MHTKETPVAGWRRWAETLLLAAVGVIAFAVYGAPTPSADVSLGWLMLVPVLSGAQHGCLYGFGSAGVICITGLIAEAFEIQLGGLATAVTQGWGFALAGIGGIAGYFRDWDERRYAQLSYRARIHAEELDTLERAHACLQWSHAQLEQQFCTQPHSLASILDAASARMHELRSYSALAELILEVVASRTPVQAASLFALGPNNHVDTQPVASLGAIAPELDVADHPLVQRALRSDALVSIVEATARERAPKGVLAAVTLQSSCGQLRLLFVVHQLPFEAFCVDELRNLHMLLARLVDLAQQRINTLDQPRRPAAAGGTRSSVRGRRAGIRQAYSR